MLPCKTRITLVCPRCGHTFACVCVKVDEHSVCHNLCPACTTALEVCAHAVQPDAVITGRAVPGGSFVDAALAQLHFVQVHTDDLPFESNDHKE